MAIKRIGLLGKLKKEKIAEYCELHAHPTPGLVQVLKETHVTNYSIFLQGDLVFSYFEYTGDDFEADMAKQAEYPAMQEWWSHSKPCFVKYAIEPDCEFTPVIKQVFFNP